MRRVILIETVGSALLMALGCTASPFSGAAAASALQPETGSGGTGLESSRTGVEEIDSERLMRDSDYAAGILQHLDRLAAVAEGSEASLIVDNLRLLALVTVRRTDEIAATIDRTLGRRPTEPGFYAAPLYAAHASGDRRRTVAVVEAASRNVPGIAWAQLRPILDRELMAGLLNLLEREHQNELRVRLADALFRVGWPGEGHHGTSDWLRRILIDDRMRQGDTAAAADFASGISTPASILSLIVQPRYDPVLAPGQDRVELLRRILQENDRVTAEALRRAPEDVELMLERVQHLRGAARDEEAVNLLSPFLRDVPATVAAHEHAIWLINDAAYALIALGRGEEAVALMRRLLALPAADHPELIGASINFIGMLLDVGRHSEALEHARALERGDARFANDFGRMWIASHAVCALADLNRANDAAPYLERLRANEAVNPGALSQAYLCLGDDASAAALMIRRLQGEDPGPAVLALQDYALSRGPAQTGGIYDRVAALRERPDVSAAFDRVGRHLTLPLPRLYWGGF